MLLSALPFLLFGLRSWSLKKLSFLPSQLFQPGAVYHETCTFNQHLTTKDRLVVFTLYSNPFVTCRSSAIAASPDCVRQT